MRSLFCTLLLLLTPLCHFALPAATDSVPKPPKFDTAYIFDYKDLLSTRLYFLIQDTLFVISPDGTTQITYKSNIPFKVGIGGFYKWFGLALAIGSPFHYEDEDQKGKSESFDLRLNLYSNVFAVEGYLHSLKGFYTYNYVDSYGDNYTNPNLRVSSIGANGYYILNSKRFSLRSVFIQNEWQKKSAGSLIGRIGFNVSKMDADSGYIPAGWIGDYGTDSLVNYTAATLVSFSLAPGYGYNLVFLKRCYLHAGAFVGAQYNYLSGKSSDVDEHHNIVALIVNLRGAIGYVGRKFHIGFSAILPGLQPFASGAYNFYWDAPQYRLWIGTRFDLFKNKNKKKQYL
jgi:hypothetical protein